MGMKVKIRQVCLQLMMLLTILVPLSNPLFLMGPLVHASSNGHFQVTGQPTGFQLGEAYGNNDNGVQLMINPEKDGTYTSDLPETGVPSDTNVRLQINWWLVDDDIYPSGDLMANERYTIIENIPDTLLIPVGGLSGELMDETGRFSFGTFYVNEDRSIAIQFNTRIYNFSEIQGSFSIDTSFDNITEELIVDLGEYGVIEVPIIVKGEEIVEKQGISFNRDTGIVEWEALINEEHRALTNVKITDFFGDNQEFVSVSIQKKEVEDEQFHPLLASDYSQAQQDNQITWTIRNNETPKRTAYRLIIRTRVKDLSQPTVHNQLIVESDELGRTETNDVEFDIVKQDFSKRIAKNPNGSDKIDFYQATDEPGQPTGNREAYDYVLVTWQIDTYYYVDGEKDPIVDRLSVIPANAASHTFEQNSLQITGTNAEGFTVGFNAENTEMTLTPPGDANGTYRITYQTRIQTTDGQVSADTIQFSNHAIQGSFGEGSAGGIIPNPSMPGIVKRGVGGDQTQQIQHWEILFNQENKLVEQVEIRDSSIIFEEDLVRLFDPNNYHGYYENNVRPFKWIYYARSLLESTLIITDDVGNTLEKGVDFELVLHNLSEPGERLMLPDGSYLHQANSAYQTGFTIRLIGDYETTDRTIKIHFSTKEHQLSSRGYLKIWDEDPSQFNRSNYYSSDPVVQGIYPWLGGTYIHPDITFFNYAKATWRQGDVQYSQDSVGYGTFGNWHYSLINDGHKKGLFLQPGQKYEEAIAEDAEQADAGNIGTFEYWTDESFSNESRQPVYTGIVDRYQTLFRLEFNPSSGPLPAGTVIEDDFSTLAGWEFKPDSVHVFQGTANLAGPIDPDTNQHRWKIAAGDYAGNERLVEGTDYRLEYDPQTQLMRIVLLKESHRPIVIFFIADYVATQELADNPLLAGSYKNIATLTSPGGRKTEVETQVTIPTESLVIKTGEVADDGEHITYRVIVNPGGAKYQNLYLFDLMDHEEETTLLLDPDTGKYRINIFEGKYNPQTQQFEKIRRLIDEQDFLLLAPQQLLVPYLPEYIGVDGRGAYQIFEWQANPENDTSEAHWISQQTGRALSEPGVKAETAFDQLAADGLINLSQKTAHFQLVVGDNTGQSEVTDKTLIVEYTAQTTADSVNNRAGVFLNGKQKVTEESITDITTGEGYASGIHRIVEFYKADHEGNDLTGSEFRLEKKSKDFFQEQFPERVLGTFTVDNPTQIGGVHEEEAYGLTNGIYRLTEITPPAGPFAVLPEPIYFKVQASGTTSREEEIFFTDEQGIPVTQERATIQLDNGQFKLTVENRPKPFMIEKNWDFTTPNAAVPEEIKEDYEITVNLLREQRHEQSDEWRLDASFTPMTFTLNQENEFKVLVEELADLGEDYRYIVKETSIINTKTGKNLQPYFDLSSGEEGDQVDNLNKIVKDANQNWQIILKNSTTPESTPERVYVGFEKQFEFSDLDYSSINYITFELFRSVEEGEKQKIQTILLTPGDTGEGLKWISNRLEKFTPDGQAYHYYIREISITDHEGSDLSERFRLADTDYILLQPHEAVQNLGEMEVVPIMNTETSGLLPMTGGPGLRFFLIAALTTIVLLLGWLFYRLRSKRNSK